MKKKLRILFSIVVVFFIFLITKELVFQNPKNIVRRILEKKNIPEIKKLTYQLDFSGIIPVGRVVVEDKGLVSFKGRVSRHFKGLAQTSTIFSIFGLKAECELKSYVDPINFNINFFQEKTSVSFKPSEYKEIIYDQKFNIMEGPKGKYAILPNTKDLLAFLFYLKEQKLELGKNLVIYFNTNQKNYVLNADVVTKNILSNLNNKNFTYYTLKASLKRYDKSSSAHDVIFKILILEDYQNIPIKFEIEAFYAFFVMYLVDIN